MAKKNTIYDVAKRAGVAISTVSRVLNQSPYVSDSTKQRVEKAIQELDFYPQVNARNLARKEAQLISVAVPTFTTPFFNEVLKGVKDEIKNTGLDFIIYNTGSDNPEKNFTGFIEKGIPDAMLIFSIEITETIHKRLKDLPIPVILIGYEHDDYDYIQWDNYHGGFIAAEHLIKQGYTKIGMIRPHAKSVFSDQRERGFRDALRHFGVAMDEDYLVSGITRKHAGLSEEAGAEAINILLSRNKLPQALFCSNDAQAIGAIHSLQEKGYSVPGDVAVMGYDNIKITTYLNLTSVDQKMYEVGKASIKRLAERIKNNDIKPLKTIIKPELVVRNSTIKPGN